METLEMMNSLEKETGDASQCKKMIGEKRERNREREIHRERKREIGIEREKREKK